MSSYKHELPKELFDGMDISNKDIDIDSCSDESIAFWIDTDYKFDKDLLAAYNERTGNDIIMPAFKDEKNPDVWLNTIYNLCKTKKGYIGTIDIESAGDFAEFDEFDVEDCIEMTGAETQRFIEVLEASFSKGIDQIFNEIQENEMVLASDDYKAGDKVRLSFKALFSNASKDDMICDARKNDTICKLSYGHIRHSSIYEEPYFDYYDKLDDIMLKDGEIVSVESDNGKVVTFATENGDQFCLSKKEADMAAVKVGFERNKKKDKTKSIERE